jgi:hypothetical protein
VVGWQEKCESAGNEVEPARLVGSILESCDLDGGGVEIGLATSPSGENISAVITTCNPDEEGGLATSLDKRGPCNVTQTIPRKGSLEYNLVDKILSERSGTPVSSHNKVGWLVDG